MYLRKITLFIIALIFICLIVLQYAISRIVLVEGLSRLEHQYTRENVNRALYALDQKISILEITVEDWSGWDDTYTFVEDKDKRYVASNLNDQTYMNLKLNLILIIDPSGKVVFGKAFDLIEQKTIPIPESLIRRIKPGDVLLQNTDVKSHVSGILLLPEGPLMLAARPILTSLKQGPIHGTMIMGRFLDSEGIKELSTITYLSLALFRLNDSHLPEEIRASTSKFSPEMPIVVRELDERYMAGYTLIKDIYGNPSLIMKAKMSRGMYAQAKRSIMSFIIAILIAGIVSAVVIMLLLEKNILSKLGLITSSVNLIGETGDISERVPMTGDDELSKLAGSINKMLNALEDSDRALKENEGKYRNLVERANDGIIIVKDKILKYANPRLAQIMGYTVEELTNASITMLLPPDEIAKGNELYARGSKGEVISEIVEIAFKHKNGSKIPVELNIGFIPYEDATAGLILIRDTTDRKKIEEMLASEKERLSITLRSIGDGVITTDMESRIVLMNRVAERLTGWTQEEALGQSLHEVFPIIKELTMERCDRLLDKILKEGVMVELINQTVLVARDGTERAIAVTGSPIRARDTAVIGMVLVFRDITEKRRFEDELLKMQRLDSVGVLAGGIAHDFNNILAGIIGNISLAKALSNKEDKLYTCLIEAEKASLRAKDLTHQLLTFSKGGSPIRKKSSISEIIKDSAEFVLRGSSVKCEYDVSWDLWLVDVDPGQISQVIQNLVLNAIQAMPEGGIMGMLAENVVVEEERHLPLRFGKYVKISVHDTGHGIPEENLPRIFDPFFTTRDKGSGLGLATAYSIINKHGGLLTVKSELNNGTTFDIYLPAAQDQTLSCPAKEEKISFGQGKILVMEDEESLRNLLKNTLNLLGYEVTLALEGKESIRLYEEAIENGVGFDAVIMDLTIPGGMGGKEAIKKLIAIDPFVKAIVSSGYSNDPVMSDYQEYGFKGVVAKPYKLAEISEVLHKVIKGKSPV